MAALDPPSRRVRQRVTRRQPGATLVRVRTAPRTFLAGRPRRDRPAAIAWRPRHGFRSRKSQLPPFCGTPAVRWPQATVRMLGVMSPAATPVDIQWPAIRHAPKRATKRWREAVGGRPGGARQRSHPPVVHRLGPRPHEVRALLGPRSLSTAAKLARQGIRNVHPSGTRWQ